MNITMLGTYGSGKTSYLSAISGLFWHDDYNNYTLQPKYPSFESRTSINSQLDRINTLYTKYQFPDSTALTTKFEFELHHNSRRVVDVNWIDYRGGDVDRLSKGELKPEESELYETIIFSDAVMVFVDASLIKAWGNGNLAGLRYKLGATYIEPILEHALQKTKLNVIFALSKSDSANIDLSKDETMLKERVRKIYSRFFHKIGGDYSRDNIIPIGVVGLGNTVIEVVDKNGFPVMHGIKNVTKMETYHVASSFAQALLLCLKSAERNTENRINLLEFELRRLEDQVGDSLLRHIIDNIFGSKKRIEIAEIRENIKNNQIEILRLSSHESGLEIMAKSSK